MSDDRAKIQDLPKPVDVQRALAEALDILASIDGDCALIGGVALAMFGIERYTKDVDLAVTESQTFEVTQRFAEADPRPLRIGGVSIATPSGVRVDLVDRRHEYRSLFEAAIAAALQEGPRVRAGDREVRVVPLPWLIATKMAADRPQDEADIDRLLRLESLDYRATRGLVYRYLGHYAARRLDRMARAAGRSDVPADYENGAP